MNMLKPFSENISTGSELEEDPNTEFYARVTTKVDPGIWNKITKDLNLPAGYWIPVRTEGRGMYNSWLPVISKGIARWFAREEGIDLSPTLERKLAYAVAEPIIWQMRGIGVKYLREWDTIQDIWQKFKKDEDLKMEEKSEKNAIPFGENYHRDVGWY